MEEFGVSRPTVRTALQRLVNDGLILRKPGIGTRIKREGRTSYWAIGSLDDLTGEFRVHQAITLLAQLETVKDFPDVKAALQLNSRNQIFHIKRIMAKDGLPYAVSNLFAQDILTKGIPSERFGQTYFVDLVQTYSGKIATLVRQEIGAMQADGELASTIGVTKGTPILVIQRTYFDTNEKPLIYVELKCRVDRYKQVINFIRGPQREN